VDSWDIPKIKDCYSSDSSYFVRIFPQQIPENYYKWIKATAEQKKKFQPEDTLVTPCHAKMYMKTKTGYSLIWEMKLINQVSPVSGMVSNDGKYFVTFDNWYSMGYGVDVMAYYNNKGELVKRHMLEDISPFPINTYEISISSIWWSCGHEFIDNERISICFIDENKKIVNRIYNLKKGIIE
jgi:hypothetical protein